MAAKTISYISLPVDDGDDDYDNFVVVVATTEAIPAVVVATSAITIILNKCCCYDYHTCADIEADILIVTLVFNSVVVIG